MILFKRLLNSDTFNINFSQKAKKLNQILIKLVSYF